MMENRWYHHWVLGASLDDQLWHQMMVMDCVLESLWGSKQNTNNSMMWTLLQCSVSDVCGEDSPWDGSMRSMRYSAVLVGCLWGLLAGEKTRVSLHLSFLIPLVDLWGFQGDCLEKEQYQMKRDCHHHGHLTQLSLDSFILFC